MKRLFVISICCIFMLLSVSGCWNRRELNDLAVTVAMGLDKAGKKTLLSDQLLFPPAVVAKGGGAPGRAPTALVEETGEGIQDAARKMTLKISKKIYVGQLQILVIGEKLARSGIATELEHFTRDHEYRRDFYVVIAKGMKARDILSIFTPLESIPANKLRDSLESSSDVWATTGAIKIGDLISMIVAKGQEPVLTGVMAEGKKEAGFSKENVERIDVPADLKYTGMAVFKKDKLVGWLTEEQSKGYNYVMGNVKSTTVIVACSAGKRETASVELIRTKAKTKFKLEHGKPVIQVQVGGEADVSDDQCAEDLSKPEVIRKLESLTNEKIKETIESAVKRVQSKYKSDIFAFGEAAHRSNPKYWKKAEKEWDEIFPDLDVKVKVDIKIREIFKTKKTLPERMKD